MKASINQVLFGTDEAVSEPLELRAGPLQMSWHGGKIWDIRVGDIEIWHGLGFVYRDTDWRTPELLLRDLASTVTDDEFHIAYSGYFPIEPAIATRVRIQGTRDGCIRFGAEAVPEADVQTNRMGICLLHPISSAGSRVIIEHIDGRESQSTMPTLIPPWPPFMLIRGIRHEYAPGCWARCRLEGDLFELEDQRNNSDASFKTYSRSNLMPRPYWLRMGVPVRQSAELRLEPPWMPSSPRVVPPVAVSVGEVVRELPKIGIEISASDAYAGEATRRALRAMRPSQLHLALRDHPASVEWKGIGDLLALAGAQLRLDLYLGDDIRGARGVLETLRVLLLETGIVPESIAVFPSEQACIDHARELFGSTLVGGGTPHFFVQLNRAERIGAVDFLTFTTSPIVHGTYDAEVMLTLQSPPSMIETLRARYPGVPTRVGPSTLGARSSPLGSQPASEGTRRLTLAKRDPRCRGLFGAAWSLGYVAQFAMAGAEAIALMSLTGDSGVMSDVDGNALAKYPTFFLLSRLHGPARIRQVLVSDTTRIAALALSRNGHEELLLANLTGKMVDVELEGWTTSAVISIMDAESWENFCSLPDPWGAMRRKPPASRCRLGPYAVMSCSPHSPITGT
jgi:D-apionolactonase